MGLFDDLKRAFSNLVTMDEWFNSARRQRLEENALQRDYYTGAHRPQLKVKHGQKDDNTILNYAGLIVDRGVAMLLGQGLAFDLPGEAETVEGEDGRPEEVDPENQRYIDAVWKVNKKDILLQKVAQFGGINGTCYFKTVPDYFEDEEFGMLPRLVPLDPLYMSVETDPEDIDEVMRYTNRFNITRAGKEVARKEVVEQIFPTVDEDGNPTEDPTEIAGFARDVWVIRNYESGEHTSGQWQLVDEQEWDYPFPPIIHWQNLPLAGSIYGKADISEDIIHLQDKTNYNASNIGKIIRYHAHPKTWGTGELGNKAYWGPDEIITLRGANAMLQNLEMQTDLSSSQAFLQTLREALFDISRTVDLASMKDKVGQLTNFGLRVLFFDSLAKLDSKRELYGEALVELNRRILFLADRNYEDDGGQVVWPEVLPVSETEETAAVSSDLALGLVSKRTAAAKRGYDWMQEQKRIEDEQSSEDSIGARLLRAFETGEQ